MISGTDQTTYGVQDAANGSQDGPQPPPKAGNGSQKAPGSTLTGLPPLPDRVRRRAVLLIGDRQLAPQQLAMIAVTARLIVHLERVSDRLMRDGELTREGEPKVLLGRVQDLSKQISRQLEDIFGSEPSDPIADVVRGAR